MCVTPEKPCSSPVTSQTLNYSWLPLQSSDLVCFPATWKSIDKKERVGLFFFSGYCSLILGSFSLQSGVSNNSDAAPRAQNCQQKSPPPLQQCSSVVINSKPPSSFVRGSSSWIRDLKDVNKANLQKNVADTSYTLSPNVWLAEFTSMLDKVFGCWVADVARLQPDAEVCM